MPLGAKSTPLLLAIALLEVSGLALAAADDAEPLTLRGDNTVIVSYDTYAHLYLHYLLARCIAKDPAAEAYRPHRKPAPDYGNAAAFPIVKAVPPGKNAIIIGAGERIPEAYLPQPDAERLASAKPGSILLRRSGTNIVVAHRGGPWDFAHLNYFLDRCCGIRMYAPDGADGLHWISEPATDSVTIGKLDVLNQPYFAKATFSSGGHERNAFWLRVNSILTEGLDLRANHGIIRFFSPETYYETHPALFPMARNGTRPRPTGDAWNPCLADPELAAEIAMQEVRKMQQEKSRGYLSFGVMDTHYACQCAVCQGSLTAIGHAGNLWYDFLNRVARQCQREFPGLYLTSYAYANIGVPQGLTLEPNIVIDNVIKSYHFTDRGLWERERDGIMAYAGLGASWVTHDWNFEGVTPRIYSRSLATFLQWGAQHGMLGMYTEWSGLEYWYLSGANYWVLRQLESDPYQDPDILWRQYCRDMYGAAWEPMYRFYDMFQQKHVVSDQFLERMDWPRQEAAAFTAADIASQRQWLEEAIEATTDSAIIQQRLAAVMRYFRAHELLVQATAVAGRLHHQYTVLGRQTGINREALAFYVNDDGRALLAFEDYYESARTVPPDSNAEDKNSSLRFSYRNNYSRALGTIIRAVSAEAMTGLDLAHATAETLTTLRHRAEAIYRANLPDQYRPERADEIGKLMQKCLWIPRQSTLPKCDGVLDDPVWRGATELTGWSLADLLLPTAEGNETEGRIMRVGKHLVIGVTCQQPNGIWAETPAEIETGTRIWRETSCEFFFGPPVSAGEEQTYIQYIVNSLGAFRGFRDAKDNRQDVYCGVKVAEDGKSYAIELAIPLAVDGLYDYSQGRVFTFNVMRNPFYGDTFNSRERIGWAPIFFTAGQPESRGLVVLE